MHFIIHACPCPELTLFLEKWKNKKIPEQTLLGSKMVFLLFFQLEMSKNSVFYW